MYILGISCYFHDAAAAILKDGILVAAAEEERFTRIKHDYAFPDNAIDYCLQEAGISGPELDYVVFYEKPLLKFERIMLSTLQTFPKSRGVFSEAMVAWFNEKLWIKSRILKKFGIPKDRLLFVEHHLSHAASALFCSPFDEAAIMTVDGVGEWSTATLGTGTAFWQFPHTPSNALAALDQENKEPSVARNSINLINEIKFPHSLGLLYSAFTAFLGFQVNEGEYKVMGMAPYGQPTRVEDVYKLIHTADDGSFELDMDYFSFHHSTRHTYSNKFLKLWGEPRLHESDFYTRATHSKDNYPVWDDATAQRNQHYADIAASIQLVTEEVLLKMANYAYKRTGLKKLCLAGGVTLNSVANGRILRETPFEDVFIQPAAGDSGGALGAALYAYHVILGQPRQFVMEHAFWGKSYSDQEVQIALQAMGQSYEKFDDQEHLASMVVDDLLAGKVVSLFQDRFEFGPRALGNRSILADPRRAEMKEIVNEKIKFREPFRPFAPVVLEKQAGEFYDGLDDPSRHYPLRYMLMVYPTKDGKSDCIQAVTHAGGTGRLQTVRKEWNPLYFRIVELFGEATGVPVLLNTSFNLRGEPIVNTPTNALNTFHKSGIESMCMDGFYVRK
jgi:carbamoyltransferase